MKSLADIFSELTEDSWRNEAVQKVYDALRQLGLLHYHVTPLTVYWQLLYHANQGGDGIAELIQEIEKEVKKR